MQQNPPQNAGRSSAVVDPTRLLALTDGLFATVLTVLVLDLRLIVPEPPGALDPVQAMRTLWPHVFGYLLTFVVAGLYWLGHHRLFDLIDRANQRLLWYNLMFLLCVGLLPFSTASLGAVGATLFGWSLYSTLMAVIGLTLTLTWGYAATHDLFAVSVSRSQVRLEGLRLLTPPVTFLLSLVIKIVTPASDLAEWFLLAMPLALAVLPRGHADLQPPVKRAPASGEVFWRIVAFLPLVAFAAWSVWLLFLAR